MKRHHLFSIFFNFQIASVIYLLISVNAHAISCTNNASPTADCVALSVNTGGISIQNSYSITASPAPLPGIWVNNSSGIVNISNLTSGSIEQIWNTGSIGLLSNSSSASIYSGSGGEALQNGGGPGSILISEIRNYGTIQGGVGIDNQAGATITTLNNYSLIKGNGGSALNNNGTIGAINNIGSSAQIASPSFASGIYNSGTISSISNQGIISGSGSGYYSVDNRGTITTLNNAQNNSVSTFKYYGVLPVNYNIIISSPSSYGQLTGYSVTGATTFGIYSGGISGIAASTLSKGTYTSVFSGLAANGSNFTGATSGNYNGFTWKLSNSSGTLWDLIVTGASTADTQQSLVNTASALQNIYTLQNSVLANSFTYDCNVFGSNDVCVSAGGRNTAVSAANGLNNTSALLIAAYRINPQYRVGAYADQSLSVNNAGPGVMLGNNTPLIGIFGAWNERTDDLGTEVKVSAAYGQKNTTITRAVVGTSEAGSGSSQLNSQGAQVVAKYGFGVADATIVSPYAGVRYTQNNMGGYTETSSSAVTAPLTYSALNTNATTVLAGAIASYKGIPQTTLFASAGVESDTNTNNGSLNATGVSGLTPVNFNPNLVKTRPTASIGAYYDIEKNQRLGITGIYRQEANQAVQTTTVMATYTIGL